MKNMNIFVTGGTGFIGKWTVATLSSAGHRVTVLARNAAARESEYRTWIKTHGGNSQLVSLVEGDLTKPELGLAPSVADKLSDTQVIYHMGAAFAWGLSAEEARLVTVGGSEALMQLAQKLNSLERIIFLSGFMMAAPHIWDTLGFDAKKQDSTQTLNQKQIDRLYSKYGAYEAAKIESEFVLMGLAKNAEIPVTSIQLSSVIGHSATGEIDQPHGVPALIASIKQGQLPVIPGARNDWLPLVSVDFLVAFITGILQLPETKGERYVLLDDNSPNFTEMVGIIADETQSKAPKLRLPTGLVKAFLKLGFERMLNTSAETLDFLKPYRYDVTPMREVAAKLQINLPDIETTLRRSIGYLHDQKPSL